MDKSNSSRSQSNKSGGGSQPRGANYGSGGKSGNSQERPQQFVQETSRDTAVAADTRSYSNSSSKQRKLERYARMSEHFMGP